MEALEEVVERAEDGLGRPARDAVSKRGGQTCEEDAPSERVESVRTFCWLAEERDGINAVLAKGPFGSEDSAVCGESNLAEQVARGLRIRLDLGELQRRREEGRVRRVARVEDSRDARVAEDARSGIDEVEVRQVSVRSFCTRNVSVLQKSRSAAKLTIVDANVAERVVGIVEVEGSPDRASRELERLGDEVCAYFVSHRREKITAGRTRLPVAVIRIEPSLSAIRVAVRDEEDDVLRPEGVL